jgi:hypothetical protein
VDLQLVAARWRLGAISPSDLRKTADELLAAGLLSPSLVELFSLPPAAIQWDGPELFERTLDELGVTVLDEEGSAWVVTRSLASGVLDGSLSPADACKQASALHIATGYEHDVLADFYLLEDELDWILPDGVKAVEDDVRALARRILETGPPGAE